MSFFEIIFRELFFGENGLASLITLDIMFGLWELSLSAFLVLFLLCIYTFFINILRFSQLVK